MNEAIPGQNLNIPQTPESLVGQTVLISPGPLLNRKRLFTTQPWTANDKLQLAVDGFPTIEDKVTQGWVGENEHGDMYYVIGDGNHHTALAIMKRMNIKFEVEGVWNENNPKPFGFNIILQRIKSDLGEGL